MSRPKAISKCTALVAKQVNRHKYRFSRRLPLPCIVMNGPPKSTAVLVNAFSDVCSLAKGSDAMICCAALAFRRLHSAHSRSHSLIASRAEMIQYRADNVAKVWLVPNVWFPFSLASLIISFVSQHFHGKITGYRTSQERNLAFFRRPSDRTSPSSSNLGFSPRSLLLAGSGRP